MADDRLLRHWFEHWVDEQPDHLALTGDDGGHFTYEELEHAANRLANRIDDLDPTKAFPVVVVAINQSTDAIVAILGASKSGRTIVPVDVAAPSTRVAHTLALLDPAVVLTRTADAHALVDVPPDRRLEVRVDDLPADGDASRRVRPLDLDGIEVIQFTSGSTGVPKGVPRPNRAAVGAFLRRQGNRHLGPKNRSALTSDFQWAAGWGTVRDAFCTGASLHRYSTRRRGPQELGSWLREERITSWGTIPSLVQAVLDAAPGLVLPDLATVNMSGDVLHRSTVDALFRALPAHAVVGNRYGASETGGVAGLSMTRDTIPPGRSCPWVARSTG